ncbi:unnamed protein product [Urochloa humidicola]
MGAGYRQASPPIPLPLPPISSWSLMPPARLRLVAPPPPLASSGAPATGRLPPSEAGAPISCVQARFREGALDWCRRSELQGPRRSTKHGDLDTLHSPVRTPTAKASQPSYPRHDVGDARMTPIVNKTKALLKSSSAGRLL